MKRGEIYFERTMNPALIKPGVQSSGRPVIIVSKTIYGTIVNVVPLTTNCSHGDVDCNVGIESTGRASTALCNNIRTVNVTNLGDKLGECSEEEMALIDEALMTALGLSIPEAKPVEQTTKKMLHSIPDDLYLKLMTSSMLLSEVIKEL